MGQWGAFGYASEFGWSYEQILAHYYGGTVLAALPAPEPDITVQLVELDGRNTIVTGVGGGDLVASWAGAPPVSAAALEVTTAGGTEQVFSGAGCAGPWHPVATTTSEVNIASAEPGAAASAPTGTSAPAPSAAPIGASEVQACIPGIGERTYQGFIVAQSGGRTDNVLPLEDYVDGVVPAESPANWANLGGEAELEAQAVAARSYALAFVASAGQICDDTACQMYTGLPDQYGLTADSAVAATAGQVLYCDGEPCGPAGSIALAEYSASTGGYTAGGAFPAVPDAGDSVAANPVHSWSVSVPVATLESAFPSVGAYQGIVVTKRNGLGQIGGRVEELVVSGDQGSVTLTGDQFAADLGLRSDWFEVDAPGTVAPPPVTTTTLPPPVTTTPVTTTPTTAPPAATTTTSPGPPPGGPPGVVRLGPDDGYWVAGVQGDVTAYGGAVALGTAAGTVLAGQVTAMAATSDYRGYWLAGRGGGVLAFGDAAWYGSASRLHLRHPIVGMAVTPDGRGYWLVSSDGGVFAFGDAPYYGSAGAFHLRARVVGVAPTPDGRGYWLVSTDGAIYAFGNAGFYGSMAGAHLNRPMVALVPSATGRGYFLVARDGGVFAFGDARFTGSLPGRGIKASVVAVTPTYDDGGYYVLASDGQVYGFGDAAIPVARQPAATSAQAGAVAIVCHRSVLPATPAGSPRRPPAGSQPRSHRRAEPGAGDGAVALS
jgi:SpoIID/LytB domain protein